MLSNTTTNSSISFLKNDFLVWFLCVAYSCFFSVMSAFSQKKEKKKSVPKKYMPFTFSKIVTLKYFMPFYLFKNQSIY